MPHWLEPLNLYRPHTWSLPRSSTFSNHITISYTSQLTTHGTYIPSIYSLRMQSQHSNPARIHNNTTSKFIPRYHYDKETTSRWDSQILFSYVFKAVSHIAKHSTDPPPQHWFSFALKRTSLYEQLLQVCLSIIHPRVLSLSQVKFSLCSIQTPKQFSPPQHLSTPTTGNITTLLPIPTNKEPTYLISY